MKFSELIAALGQEFKLDYGDPEISGVSTLLEAQPKDLGFLENSRFFSQLAETKAGALFVNTDTEVLELVHSLKIPYISVPQPRLLFARAIAVFYPPRVYKPSIHPSAVIGENVEIGEDVFIIGENVEIGEDVFIAPHVVIGSGSKIGNSVIIHANVTIYEDVFIGDRTVLHANCVIHERSEIGKNCVIHSGAAIGAEGFGFVPSSDGTWAKMQQVGKTILEDNVEVGCNAAIDRGAVGDTRIGKGSKIDKGLKN